jgi:MFS family permease
MNRMNPSLLAAATLANGLLIGLIPTFVDAIKTPLQIRLALTSERADWFVRLFYIAWLPAMPLAGVLLDFLPNYAALFFGLVTLILAVAWLGLARTSAMLLINAVLLGIAYSVVTTATVRLMTTAFFPDYGMLNIAALNLGFVAVGVGALLGPWVVVAIERWGSVRQGLLYLAIALMVPAAMVVLSGSSGFPSRPEGTASWHEVFTHPPMTMVIAVILIYFALENCLEFWPARYLKEIGYQERGARISEFVFWLAFIATRGAAAWWLYWHPAQGFYLTLILFITSAVVLGIVAEGYDLGSGTFWFWLLGSCYGPLLPGLLGIAIDLYPDPKYLLSGGVVGALLALSGFDTLVMRPVMRVLAQNGSARNIMRVPTVLAILAAGVLIGLAFVRP